MQADQTNGTRVLGLGIGKLVEILTTLDENGELDACRSCPRCWPGAAGGSGSTSSPSSSATELLRAAPERIPSWSGRQYVQDVRSGNASALATVRTVGVGLFNEYQDASRGVLPRPLRIRGDHLGARPGPGQQAGAVEGGRAAVGGHQLAVVVQLPAAGRRLLELPGEGAEPQVAGGSAAAVTRPSPARSRASRGRWL
jgi:hypothetical protein